MSETVRCFAAQSLAGCACCKSCALSAVHNMAVDLYCTDVDSGVLDSVSCTAAYALEWCDRGFYACKPGLTTL